VQHAGKSLNGCKNRYVLLCLASQTQK
jgi:hypothetical protein